MDKQSFLVLAGALIISFSGLFINLFRSGKRGKVQFVKDDHTLFWFRIFVPLALVVSILFYFSKIGSVDFPPVIILFGYLLFISGLIIRWVAVASLGNAFTVQVSILENHRLKTTGIYSIVRHPSYTGLLFYYFALGLMMSNWICMLLLSTLPLFVVLIRIKVEEKVLLENFKTAYESYQKQSWRLFPYLY